MKQNKLFLGLAALFAAAFTFTACTSDDAESQTTQESGNIINFTYGPAMTRTATDPQSGNSVSVGLNVGIFGVSSEGTTTMKNYTNTKYLTASGNALSYAGTEGNEMTWPTDGSATASIYAYAPYQEDWTVDAANTFTVGADQSDDNKYLASDLLYASATNKANGSTVALTFGHKLAKVNVTITKAESSTTNLTGAKIYITGTKRVAKFTPSTGVVAVDGTASPSDILALTINEDLTAGDANSKATACAVVVPQDLAAETAFVKIVTSDSKTLIGKLSSAATLASNGTYSMNISVGNVTETETVVKVSFGSTSLVAWGADTAIGLTAYGVGDYVLTDGTFMKASAYSSASTTEKNKIAGIIFSTKVSDDDKDEYNAYAMGLKRMKQKFPTNDAYKSQMCTTTAGFTMIESFEGAFNDLNGRTRTGQMMKTGDTYYGTLGENQSSFIANLSWYTRAISANASEWYLPSFGQLIQIFNNLGGLSITSTSYTVDGSGNVYPYVNDATSYIAYGALITTLNAKINVVKGHVQITDAQDIFSDGDIVYASSTENGSASNYHYGKIWGITFKSSSGWGFGKNISRTNSADLSVIPVVAVKLPAVAQ